MFQAKMLKTGVYPLPGRYRESESDDRDDTVRQALADSENLIVVCSPAAATSRWASAGLFYGRARVHPVL
jgi:hypothetical protein